MDEQKQDGQEQDGGEVEKLAKMKAALAEEIQKVDVQGVPTGVTRLDVVSGQWRQMAVKALKSGDEESYAEYRRRKYGEGETAVEDPDLKTRKMAYLYAVTKFLDVSYTEVEPDEPTKLQVVGEMWRQKAVQLLRVIAPDVYAGYRRRKYGEKGENKNPDFETRFKAYRFAVRQFLQKSYRLAGF